MFICFLYYYALFLILSYTNSAHNMNIKNQFMYVR